MKNITINDVKKYIKELEIQKEFLLKYNKDNYLLINWYTDRIKYFKKRLSEEKIWKSILTNPLSLCYTLIAKGDS